MAMETKAAFESTILITDIVIDFAEIPHLSLRDGTQSVHAKMRCRRMH